MSKVPVLVCSLSLLLIAAAAHADDGKDLFQQKCSSCHTVGGGDRVGPDLKGVGAKHPTEWLVGIITDPDKLTADKDPAQLELVKKYGMQMPKLGVSPDDAKKIVSFLEGGGAAAKGEAAPAAATGAAPAAPPTPPTRQMVASGQALFTGKTPFAKGGPPCVSCHSVDYPGVHGGALAANLTNIYAGMGNTGIRAVLGSLSFPVMRKVYADRPLTDAEKDALVAFFQDASAKRWSQSNPYPAAGLGFFVVFIIAAAVLKRRIR